MASKRVLSFRYAFEGVWTALKDEPNLKFHFLVGFLVILAGFYFGISKIEWLVVLLTIGFVVAVELTNTAIEEVVDSFTSEVHPSAKKAKDVSAGAVLVVSMTALITGAVIFLPYIFKFLSY